MFGWKGIISQLKERTSCGSNRGTGRVKERREAEAET